MLFALTTFVSAGLVFMVQPMAAKLILPLLGGSPSVWNTSMAFFQGALLAGADLLARGLLAPQELPVGVLTAALGGSYLLWLMHRRVLGSSL